MTGAGVPAAPAHPAPVRPGLAADHPVAARLDTATAHTDVGSAERAGRAVHHGGGQQVVGGAVGHTAVQLALVTRQHWAGGMCSVILMRLYSQSVYFGIQVTAAGRSGMLCCLVLWAAHCSSLKSVWAGQGTVLQLWYRTRSPRQKEPPCWGAG